MEKNEKLLNARKARKLTEETLSDSSEETLETLQMIRFFAINGEFSLLTEKKLNAPTVKTLVRLGYHLQLVAKGFSGTAHKISW